MLGAPFTPDELARYAAVAIDRCLDLRPGELLLVNYEHEHRPLALALAEAAYRRGLRVDANVSDPLFDRAEIDLSTGEALGWLPPWRVSRMHARTEPGTAVAYIDGPAELDALAGGDPERLSLRARRHGEQFAETIQRVGADLDSSVILAYPTLAWARRVYPELPPGSAQRALADDLLRFARIGPEDGAGDEALTRHIASLLERAGVANRLRLRELRLRGPGTDLRLGLTEDAIWKCAGETNGHGRAIFGNLPSEEIYTSPAASATEGTVRCTTPLVHRGLVFEDLAAEFRDGRLVRLDARTDEQRAALLGELDIDAGGRRLGEVALVDAASRVGQRGRLYWNTLLDENQACHIALGLGFANCRRDGQDSADLNSARTHVDVMIGSPEVEVTGTTATGETVVLIEDGVWRPT
jgi:aminopeptidase